MTNKEKTKGFVFTDWISTANISDPKTTVKCIGFDISTGEWSECVQDSNGNRINTEE